MRLHVEIETWPLATPFRITGYTFVNIEVVMVVLEEDGHVGRAEAAGVYYRGDTPATMVRQIESVRETVESGMDRESLQRLMPPCGARNALDCALWDLEAKRTRRDAWQVAGLDEPRPLLTTFTCGADSPERMAAQAATFPSPRALKLKLTGETLDAARVHAVRAANPQAWLGVDANQGFTRKSLEQLMPALIETRVALIEQPFPVGQEAQLDGFRSSIPIAADESAQSLADLPALAGRFQVVNIKLDKCGGLTEGLAIARRARASGLEVMVGNMLGTSLAMAPALLLGQLCEVVDLDGPALLTKDRAEATRYEDGHITRGESRWGRSS